VKSEGVSEVLARHAAEFPAEALPPATLHAAKRALLDGVGVMLAASGLSPDAAPFIALAKEGQGVAPILGTGATTSPALAALAN
jgi:2-methylcitrate dehydratase PrpD